MVQITYITPTFAVSPALAAEDFAAVKELGFKAVLSNRPDDEQAGQLNGRAEAVHAWRHGLAFRHLPENKLELFSDPLVEGMEQALRGLDGPVLAHCQSGIRSAILWAAASARQQPVDCVLAALKSAGFDLDFIRDDLEGQAHRKNWLGMATALDCSEASKVDRRALAAA